MRASLKYPSTTNEKEVKEMEKSVMGLIHETNYYKPKVAERWGMTLSCGRCEKGTEEKIVTIDESFADLLHFTQNGGKKMRWKTWANFKAPEFYWRGWLEVMTELRPRGDKVVMAQLFW